MYSHRVFFLLMLLMVFVDLSLIILSLSVAYNVRFNTPLLPALSEYHPWEFYLPMVAVEVLVFGVVFAAREMYHLRRNSSRLDELQHVFVSVAIGALVTVGVIAFFLRDFPYSRPLVALSWLLVIPFIWAARLLQFKLHGLLRRTGLGSENVLLVGSGEIAHAVLQKMQHAPTWGYQVVGFVTDWSSPQATRPHMEGLPSLGSLEHIDTVVQRYGIREVIIADPTLNHQQVLNTIQRLDPRQVSIKVFPDVFQLMSSEVSISDLHGLPLVSVRDAALRGWRQAVKRVVDVAVSSVTLVLLSPLMLLIALLIKLTSPAGPVFYAQERVGLDGRPFWVLKFRSMRPDAEATTGPVWAGRGDPRVTTLGRLLRRFSLDELPQFVNVVMGDMSIVGPRPERPHFVKQFTESIPHYWERHREKAGLTGWAQVNGLRGDTSIEERTAYDLWYVENWTLWLDFKIMLRTIIAVFRDSNG